MSKIYILNLSQKSGLLTQLQSDTIFGHFCWRMRDLIGEDKLKEFLESYRSGCPVFTVSNSFFERDKIIYLPNSLLPFSNEKKETNKDEKIRNFLKYKDSKKMKFLTLKQFNFALNGEKEELEKSILEVDVKQPKYIEDLRTSVEISRETFSSKESQLFSYAPYYVQEELINSKRNEFTKTNTVIFIKILYEEKFNEKNFDCENILKDVFNIGFGKKKSSGYGEFEVNGFDNFEGFKEPDDSNGFITLSNYLPSVEDKITADNSYYDLNIKYGKLGEELALSLNPFKKPIVFMTPGSCFKTDVKKDYYGRCVRDIVELSGWKDKVLQNGIAFTLRIRI
ncbi:MAG: hypothetical protein JSS91_07620 [Bacteroidetes bacterium]|nr:hypothetical protein [Bacteroidota bacterium]